MEKHELAHSGEEQSQSQSPRLQPSPPVAGKTLQEKDTEFTNEKPHTGLHSEQNLPRSYGRHSIDVGVGRPTVSDSKEGVVPPAPAKEGRSLSEPELDRHRDGRAHKPAFPPPVHAPTNIQSSRQHAVRSSAEFDRRFDGPFGRPSLAFVRRQSTHVEETLADADQGEAIHEGEAEDVQDATAQSTPQVLEPTPPPLNYSLRSRKWAIFIFWFFIVFDSVIMPIALYFGLWYGVGPGSNTPTEKKEKLSANATFSIVTAAIGGASILEYIVRFWRLWKKNSTCRVIGARRRYLDLFHWNFSLAWFIIMVELIVGTSLTWPPIRLLSVPVPTMLIVFGTELLLVDTLRLFRVPAPIRMSSVPKGAQLRPCIYTMIEDVVAVDGSGGTEFREALNRRYEASHVFRTMLRRLGIFWAVGAESMAVVCFVLIFTLSGDAAYCIGWAVPFAWAGVWALGTMWYVKKELRRESVAWTEEVSKHTA